MARTDWKMITLRIPPEVHWVLKKYSNGEYQVALRELIKRYAKRLLEQARVSGQLAEQDSMELEVEYDERND